MTNPIVETYSRLAQKYDDDLNLRSCWGRAAERSLGSLQLKPEYCVVLDVGCGTGRALVSLASRGNSAVRFIGVDPAENMRNRALEHSYGFPNITILDGSFEHLPLESASVDYLYSIFAFHWTTDLQGAVREISRVLKPAGEMDLFFIGRDNGREFIQKTTPIFLKYMGPKLLLESARLRKQLTREGAFELFAGTLGASGLTVEESYDTYYDTLEGHWGWWVRIEGHFMKLPPEKRDGCNQEVHQALGTLASEKGVPYTLHQLHVKLRRH